MANNGSTPDVLSEWLHLGMSLLQEDARGSGHMDSMKLLIHNLDLSYRLEWVSERKVLLTRHGQELGTFPL